MPFQEYAIGEMARAGGCKVQTVRYYEKIGLLAEPRRSAGNQRIYDQSHMDRLAFIRHSREMGFPLPAIRELLELADDRSRSCAQVDLIAQAHLEEVESRIQRLRALKGELVRMIEMCRGGRIEHCRIIEVLADHSHARCLAKGHR